LGNNGTFLSNNYRMKHFTLTVNCSLQYSLHNVRTFATAGMLCHNFSSILQDSNSTQRHLKIHIQYKKIPNYFFTLFYSTNIQKLLVSLTNHK
jgi:hypothetical protein